MASLLEWTFKLNDKVSGPARSASMGVGYFVQSLHSAMAVMQLAVQGAQTLGSGLASVLEPAVRKEKTLGAFEQMLGSSALALDKYREAVQFANETPFETRDIVSGYKQLLAAQFKPEDLQTIVRIVGDASSLQEAPAEAMKGVNRALGQIMSKGKLSQEELNQVAEAVPLNQAKLTENLARLTGVSLGQIQKLRDSSEGIRPDIGVYAVLQTLQQQFGGNMERASKQVSGLWSTIASMPSTYLEKLQDTRGYESLRKSLSGIVSALDPASKTGQRLQTVIDSFGGGILERLFGGEPGRIDRAFGTLVDLLETTQAAAFGVVDGFSAAYLGLSELDQSQRDHKQTVEDFRVAALGVGTAFGVVAGAGRVATDAIGTLYGWMERVGKWTAEHPALLRLMLAGGGAVAGGLTGMSAGAVAGGLPGAAIGLVGGVVVGGSAGALAPDALGYLAPSQQTTGTGVGTTQEMLQKVRWNQENRGYSDGVYWGDQYEEGVRDRLGIHSPSRVAQELGGYFSQGFAAGVSGGRSSGADSGGTSVPVINLTFNYTAGVKESGDVERMVESGIRQALERWRVQAGR